VELCVVCKVVLELLGVALCCVVADEDIDLKVASKFFGGRFACGSSVTGDDEIVIQGDIKDELFDVLTEKWPQVYTTLMASSCHVVIDIDHLEIDF